MLGDIYMKDRVSRASVLAALWLLACQQASSRPAGLASTAGTEPPRVPSAPPPPPPVAGSLPPGSNAVHVINPSPFAVEVELRSGDRVKTFSVPASGDVEVSVADGKFEVSFAYANEPGKRYVGDSFALENRGIEIRLEKGTVAP